MPSTSILGTSILGGALAVALALAPMAKADPVKIRMGWVAAPASLVPILFPKEGIAKHNGISYTVEAIHFQGSPLQITAQQSGEIDIAALHLLLVNLVPRAFHYFEKFVFKIAVVKDIAGLVLGPFKVGDDYAAGVGQNVRHDLNSFFE